MGQNSRDLMYVPVHTAVVQSTKGSWFSRCRGEHDYVDYCTTSALCDNYGTNIK